MKITRWLLSLACLPILLSVLSGCSNYVEIEKLIIVAGAAIDFDPSSGAYTVTTEILNRKTVAATIPIMRPFICSRAAQAS